MFYNLNSHLFNVTLYFKLCHSNFHEESKHFKFDRIYDKIITFMISNKYYYILINYFFILHVFDVINFYISFFHSFNQT